MYLERLNKQQKQAVFHFESPLLVLAGAGSGKTGVITAKIAYAVKELGYDPNRVLAMTFTKKAANEMKERTEKLLGVKPRWIQNFHSFCNSILREHINVLGNGLTNRFIIYDEDDSLKVLKDTLEKLNMKECDSQDVMSLFSRCRQEYATNVELDIRTNYGATYANVFHEYKKHMIEANAVDFDDLVYYTTFILDSVDSIKEKIQKRFDYTFVDEFQDTNKIQYYLLKLLVGDNKGITCVADPQQCIYTWRQANPENVLNYIEDFHPLEIQLDRNYRSTTKVLDIANTIISVVSEKWKSRILRLWTDKDGGKQEDVAYESYDTCFVENRSIALKIKELGAYSNIAVLVRAHYLSGGLEREFIRNGIPYEIVGGLKFNQRAEIKDLLGYLRIITNPKDKIAFDRVINTPERGLGDKALVSIRENYKTSWLQACKDTDFKNSKKDSVNAFLEITGKYSELAEKKPYTAILSIMTDIDYINYLTKKYPKDHEARKENISELINMLCDAENRGLTFMEFMEDSLLGNDKEVTDKENTVKIMTVHAAKGLEFPVVFIPALEEGIFPSALSIDEASKEEERRLFYVAVTRAKEKLFLSSAAERMKFGKKMENPASRFVAEIEKNLFIAARELLAA